MTRIKICGLFREQDIGYVNEAMPDYAGFILNFPKSHRNITVEQAENLRSRLRPEILPVCVFVDQPLEAVICAAEKVNPAVIQLHGNEGNAYIAELKEKTGREVWKAFRIQDEADLKAAAQCCADAVLLDNGCGTGEGFDWSKVEAFPRPFILAGGLTPENIPDAVARLHPGILDISSGVETNRLKDREKMIAAVQAAHMGSRTGCTMIR